ncbi:MAG: M48 family metallopeptidase [Actinobacteria bacterium]|nr:M48 family metallopeptidase [Actinomycetota bacterium]
MDESSQIHEPTPGGEATPLTLFPPDEIFDYSIRVSPRARTVRLNMTPEKGLVVVVPAGYSLKRVPGIVRSKKTWIENARRWADERRQELADRRPPSIPAEIDFHAIGETWSVAVNHTDSSRTVVREHSENHLRLTGRTGDTPQCLLALSRWTGRKARAHLVPWLHELSSETGLEFEKAIIGNQQTRWASCSPKRTISLNQKLLFLPPHLVRYVLVHELCHIRQLNHSRRFWSLVARHEPSWREHRRELGESWQLVPSWLDR